MTIRTHLGAQRYNNRMAKIWDEARRLERERLARGEQPNPNLTPPAVTRSPAQIAYEADVAARPTYDGGVPRKAWDELDGVSRWSWERNPTPRQYASEPTEQGNQLVIPGCERDRSRGPTQGDLF